MFTCASKIVHLSLPLTVFTKNTSLCLPTPPSNCDHMCLPRYNCVYLWLILTMFIEVCFCVKFPVCHCIYLCILLTDSACVYLFVLPTVFSRTSSLPTPVSNFVQLCFPSNCTHFCISLDLLLYVYLFLSLTVSCMPICPHLYCVNLYPHDCVHHCLPLAEFIFTYYL